MQVFNGPENWKKKQTNKQIVTLQHLMASRKSATKTLIDKLRVADTNNSRLNCWAFVADGMVGARGKLSSRLRVSLGREETGDGRQGHEGFLPLLHELYIHFEDVFTKKGDISYELSCKY